MSIFVTQERIFGTESEAIEWCLAHDISHAARWWLKRRWEADNLATISNDGYRRLFGYRSRAAAGLSVEDGTVEEPFLVVGNKAVTIQPAVRPGGVEPVVTAPI